MEIGAHFFRPSSMEKTTGEHNTSELEIKAATTTTPKSRLRKNRKLNDQAHNQGRKVTQRGIGVEKLERMRLQERWKFMTGTDSVSPSSNLPFQSPVPYFDPKNRPLPVSVSQFFNNPSYVHCEGNDGIGFSSYRYSNGGFAPDSVKSLSLISNGGFDMNHGGEEPSPSPPRFQFVEQPAKELSPIQMTHCLSEKCLICFKKKLQTPEMLGFKQMNGYHPLGLSLGSPRTVDGHNTDQAVEVKAVHRKRNAVRGESVFMEYEFFPSSSTTTSSSSNKDSSVSEGMDGGSGSVTPTTPTAHFLDLSLKLW